MQLMTVLSRSVSGQVLSLLICYNELPQFGHVKEKKMG